LRVPSAHENSFNKAGAELAAANVKLIASGKDPIVVAGSWRIFDPTIQAELRRNGITIKQDTTGWETKSGTPISVPSFWVSDTNPGTWNEVNTHVARLQKALVPERAALNIFLFVGPDDKAVESTRNLTSVVKRNGGTFQLLTTKRLEEIKAKEDAAASK